MLRMLPTCTDGAECAVDVRMVTTDACAVINGDAAPSGHTYNDAQVFKIVSHTSQNFLE